MFVFPLFPCILFLWPFSFLWISSFFQSVPSFLFFTPCLFVSCFLTLWFILCSLVFVRIILYLAHLLICSFFFSKPSYHYLFCPFIPFSCSISLLFSILVQCPFDLCKMFHCLLDHCLTVQFSFPFSSSTLPPLQSHSPVIFSS